METTPVSSRRRTPRWMVPPKKLDIGVSPVRRTSSPASSSRDTDSTISPVTPSAEFQRQMIEFEDDYDEVMPCTQNYNAGREVFWNYEASPKTRGELRRQMAETDCKEEKKKKRAEPKPKPVTPVIKLRTTSSRSVNEDLHNDETFLFLTGIAETIENTSNSSTSTSNSALKPSSPKSENSLIEEKSEAEDDPFNKDDSFFLQCSQALDEYEIKSQSTRSLDSNSNHTFKVPEVKRIASPLIQTAKSSTATSTVTSASLAKSFTVLPSKSSTVTTTETFNAVSSKTDDFFDDGDDGEFEMMLSQIELPAEQKTQPAATTAAFRSTASVPPPKPVIFAPQPGGQNCKVNTNQFKRFKSADDVTQGPVTCSSAQTTSSRTTTVGSMPHQPMNTRPVTGTSSFRRFNTLPETSPGPLPGGRQAQSTVTTSRCSKEEIERKRQEALKRRQMNSQKFVAGVEQRKF